MSKGKYGEPWQTGNHSNKGGNGYEDMLTREGEILAEFYDIEELPGGVVPLEDVCSRVAACVNALEGVDDPVAFVESAKALEAEYNEQCRLHQIGMERETRLIAERDAAERDLRKLKLKVISYGHRLAAAQAAAERQANK